MTDLPYGSLTAAEYLRHLRRDADDLIAALRKGPLDAPVPTCPEWTVRELAAHLGGVHEWVCRLITDGPNERQHGTIAGEVSDWYAERVDQLLRLLRGTDPDQPCWSPQDGNHRVAFWCRRQAHEVAMHRADARFALHEKPVYQAELAADGIGEVLDILIPRMSAFKGPPPLTAPLRLRCTDGPQSWLLTPNPDGPPHATRDPATGAAVEVSGTASDLLFRLWKRPADVVIDGDRNIAEQFLGAALTS